MFPVILVALVAGLPIVLLFFATFVPRWIAAGLLILDIAVVLLVSQLEITLPVALLAIAALIGLAALAVWLSQRFATTPPITDANGQPLPGSIAVMEKVQLNGSDQWITIRGKNRANPVLLYLAGGPGSSDLAWTRLYLSELENHFIVVNWDQPGSAKSHRAVDIATLTPERYINDAHALTEQLRQRFGQVKIYVLGHSWGSILGIWLVQCYPELFHAYAGCGQVVSMIENDRTGYELALRYAEETGDTKNLAAMKAKGAPPYSGKRLYLDYVPYSIVLLNYMNAHASGESGKGRPGLTRAMLTAGEYGLIDKINYIQGGMKVFTQVYPQLESLDLEQQAAELKLPVYFLLGRHDVNAMSSLAERYYQHLVAPHKELIWLEKSGHLPQYEEPKRFVQLMVHRVLRQPVQA